MNAGLLIIGAILILGIFSVGVSYGLACLLSKNKLVCHWVDRIMGIK